MSNQTEMNSTFKFSDIITFSIEEYEKLIKFIYTNRSITDSSTKMKYLTDYFDKCLDIEKVNEEKGDDTYKFLYKFKHIQRSFLDQQFINFYKKEYNEYEELFYSSKKNELVINVRTNSGTVISLFIDDIEFVKLLIENGADIHIINEHKDSALILASKNNNLKMIELLLEKGANSYGKNFYDENALVFAIDNKNDKIVDKLLESEKIFDMKNLDVLNLNRSKYLIDFLMKKGEGI